MAGSTRSILSKYEYGAKFSKKQYKENNTINFWRRGTLSTPTINQKTGQAVLKTCRTPSPHPARNKQPANESPARLTAPVQVHRGCAEALQTDMETTARPRN